MADSSCNNESKYSTHEVPDDILMEVLSWLPGKSLMRFKSVSKHWFSLITHPAFVDMHHTRSNVQHGDVFLVIPPCSRPRRFFGCVHPYGWDRRFLMIDSTRKDPMNRASVYEPSVPYTTNSVSNIVNGLICFYHRDDLKGCVSVYNFTTRENLPLPPLPVVINAKNIERRYLLGFDPLNKAYKVLHYCSPLYNWSRFQCDVFTVGGNDNTWRPINIISPDASRILCCESNSYVYIDGSLYWNNEREKVILEFDVAHEKFDFIDYPQIEKPDMFSWHSITLTQLRGQLSLVALPYSHKCYGIVLRFWRLMDRKDNHRPLWTNEIAAYPFLNYEKHPIGCSSFGLVSLVRNSPIPGHVIIDCYMLATRKHQRVNFNNAQALLKPDDAFRH